MTRRDTLKDMSSARQVMARLRLTGIAFLLALFLFFVFYFMGFGALLVADFLLLVPLSFIMALRLSRYVVKHSLWSLRNRLLCVYGMFGFVPVVLLFLLFTITMWSFMSELAIYLANSALDRRLQGVQACLDYLRRIPDAERPQAGPRLREAFAMNYTGITLYERDGKGSYRWPADGPDLRVPQRWRNVHGLLVRQGKLYAWAHYVDDREELSVLSPLSDQAIAGLVPNLGVIALAETEDRHNDGHFIVGSLNLDESGSFNPFTDDLPKAVSRWDIPIALPSVQAHFHLDDPGETHGMVLWVHSRPSAVLRAFFYNADLARGFVADILAGIAVLFLLVEIAAIIVGASLSRRITGAVNQLYAGTQLVISGDFSHRIQVASEDQLGELTESFNEMTGHLERLLVSEKERERLQAEIEIAREVQNQLYPREGPPQCGLRLTARCDPARMVSGDYYDYALLRSNQLAFAMGDVAGKGISAALLMATIQAALRAQLSHAPPLAPNECGLQPQMNSAALVSSLNKQVYEHTSPEKYATFFFGVYDDVTRILTYTNAGHLSPLLFRKGNVVRLDSNGTVIGAFPKAVYDESCVTIESGDLLVCYTDGITEPENAFEEEFGEKRLVDLVQKHIHAENDEIIRIVFDAVRSWTGVPELSDDMTLLLARQVDTQ